MKTPEEELLLLATTNYISAELLFSSYGLCELVIDRVEFLFHIRWWEAFCQIWVRPEAAVVEVIMVIYDDLAPGLFCIIIFSFIFLF